MNFYYASLTKDNADFKYRIDNFFRVGRLIEFIEDPKNRRRAVPLQIQYGIVYGFCKEDMECWKPVLSANTTYQPHPSPKNLLQIRINEYLKKSK